MTEARINRIRENLEKRNKIQDENWLTAVNLILNTDRRIDYYSSNKRKLIGWIIFKIFEEEEFQLIQDGKNIKEKGKFNQNRQAVFLFQNRKKNWELFFYQPYK